MANGIVTGHIKLLDAMPIHTSDIKYLELDDTGESVIIQTQNTKYICDIKSMKIDKVKEFIDKNKNNDISWLKHLEKAVELYKDYEETFEIEDGTILLVLGNTKPYYFKYFGILKDGIKEEIVRPDVHVGMIQDSVLCMKFINENLNIDLRYFPYQFNNIEFYSFENEGLDVFIENCGENTLRVKNGSYVYEIKPNERVKITPENAVENKELTSNKDLYSII